METSKLIEDLYKTSDALAKDLCVRWDIPDYEMYWVGGDPTGVLCVGDIFISLSDLVYILRNNIAHDEVWEWQCYNVDADEFSINRLNLKSWHSGAPRTSQETFDRLRALRSNIDSIIDDENTRTSLDRSI